MTYKERMLACIKGQKIDRLPYAPKLDLWYSSMPGTYDQADFQSDKENSWEEDHNNGRDSKYNTNAGFNGRGVIRP